MKHLTVIFIVAALSVACSDKPVLKEISFETICNPLNLSYRFQPDEPSRREAADPSVIRFKDRYFLFASKSGGYWHSGDLITWEYIETDEIPTEEYAPTAIAIDDTLYFLASSREKSTIYKSADPLSGKWEIAVESLDVPVWDPAFFLDDDKSLYLYWGCSNTDPLYGVEIDYRDNFSFMGQLTEPIFANPDRYGWEVPGDYNTMKETSPWIEGPWMNKYHGEYYLQYAGPGTEFKSYSDGVYVSDNPLGPYDISPHNPVAYRPEGFAAGAGHGSTFMDEFGNYWHIGTITISIKHMFERRLGLFPAFFDQDGILYSVTKFGDYPLIVPQKKIENFEDIFPGWMLLSCRKKVTVSSSIDSHPPENMVDEDIRTYWAAASGNAQEWASIDMGDQYDVHAVQVNFGEHEAEVYSRKPGLSHQYTIAYSEDNVNWEILVDKSENRSDNSHDYIQLLEKVKCRYLKINNKKVPGGHFALSGFRVFGKGDGKLPSQVKDLTVSRNPEDRRSIKLTWTGNGNATGYNICYGTAKNRLYHTYQVYYDISLVINSLDANQPYYFSIESFNENGVTGGGPVVAAE
ncbi:MAG: family 43 glycosylhydrolase [Cyclobacteriaceae bacterium]|nr:family 43 glycosylhydrolase [Cyclobacteriaceae bacterium]